MALAIFERVCSDIEGEFTSIPDGTALFSQIRGRLQSIWDEPPFEDLSVLLGKHLTEDETRIIFFAPEQDQIRYYVAMLECAPEAFPSSHPLRKVQPLAITLIYLIHRRKWAFLEEFVLHGGLRVLAVHVAMENLYYRGQVLEILLAITDVETFDWFKAKEDTLNKNLHMRMLELHANPIFLTNLLQNRVGSYPGGSFRCLQLLAFWLSWVRVLYTEDKKLLLSSKMLQELTLWAGGHFGDAEPSVAVASTPEGDDDPRAEEKKLAQTLVDDFGSHGSVEGRMIGGIDAPDAPRVEELPDKVVKEEAVEVVQDVADLKGAGSELYRSGMYSDALDKYTEALDMLMDKRDDAENTQISHHDYDVEASLHFNRANTWWKLAEEERMHKDAKPEAGEEYLAKAQQACQMIFRLVESGHGRRVLLKAAYRHASIELTQGQTLAGIETIDKFIATAGEEGSSDMDMLRQLRRKCLASHLAAQAKGSSAGEDEDQDTSSDLLDVETRAMMNQLFKRKGRELRRQAHPWDGWSPPEDDGNALSGDVQEGAVGHGTVGKDGTGKVMAASPSDDSREEDIGEMVNRLNMKGKPVQETKEASDLAQKKRKQARAAKLDSLANITGIPSRGRDKDKDKDKKKSSSKKGKDKQTDKEVIFRKLQLF